MPVVAGVHVEVDESEASPGAREAAERIRERARSGAPLADLAVIARGLEDGALQALLLANDAPPSMRLFLTKPRRCGRRACAQLHGPYVRLQWREELPDGSVVRHDESLGSARRAGTLPRIRKRLGDVAPRAIAAAAASARQRGVELPKGFLHDD